MLQWVRAAYAMVSRALSPAPVGTAWLLPDGATSPSYDPETALSTLARFPWVWTCARAIADDSATLPLVAVRDMPDGTRRVIPDDPGLRLLRQPGGGWTENLFRRQLRIDYELTGNAYVWRPSPVELIRLHPSRVRPIVATGIATYVTGYRVRSDDGTHVEIPRDQALHIRDVSWEQGATAALGESVIRCLHDDLTMELNVRRLAAQQAKRGRPDVIFSSEAGIAPEDQDRINQRWEQSAKDGRLAFTVGQGLEVQTLSWSPREFEFAARSESIRDVILAAFGVPAARAGLVTANYGTQKQQMRTYWEGIRARTKAFDDAFSTLAAPGVRIEHDFADVEALQVSYTERQQRIVTWVSLGASPDDAAAYEGFDDAPKLQTGNVSTQFANVGLPALVAAGIVSTAAARRLLGVGEDAAPSPEELELLRPSAAPSGQTTPKPSSGSGTTARPEEPQGDKTIAEYLAASAPRVAEMARQAEAGVSILPAVRLEVERAFAVLVEAGADPVEARALAEDEVAVSVEAARAAIRDGHDPVAVRAFTPARASKILARITTEAA